MACLLGFGLSARCELNGLFYTSTAAIEMNVVVSTSLVRGCVR